MRTLPSELISLLQYVELNRSNWWEETVDRSVLAVLWSDKTPYSPQKIKYELEKRLEFNVRLYEIQASIKRLVAQGKILGDNTDRYIISIDQRGVINSQVNESLDLERKIITSFSNIISPSCESINSKQLWDEFKQRFLIPLVSDLGIRVYEFFTKKKQELPWVYYIENFLDIIPEECQKDVRQSITIFLDPDNDDLAQFILRYLDAYLLISAYGLSTQTLNTLKSVSEENIDFIIFVDTNVIFSLLDLHTNPSNETVSQLMELVSSVEKTFNICFVASPITLKETQDAIKYYRDQLAGSDFPLNLVEVGKFAGVSGVYRRYFDRVQEANQQINVIDYFEPYLSQIDPILGSKGVTVFKEGNVFEYESIPKVISDIDVQKRFENDRYKEHAKGIDQITKDVALWHFVQDQRKPHTTSPLHAKYWVLTIDYHFLSFDRFKKKGSDQIPICIHPSQLIQLLRFFVPSSPQIGKILLGTIITPIISRGLNGKTEQTIIRILKRLSRFEGIEDVPVGIITKMLADEALVTQLEKQNDVEKEDKIIHDRIAQELAQSSRLVEEKNKNIEQKTQEIDVLKEKLQGSTERLDKLSEQFENQKIQIDEMSKEKKKEDERLFQKKSISDFRRVILAFLIPYILLLPTAWIGFKTITSLQQIPWIQYLVLGICVLLLTMISIWYVRNQGDKNQFISTRKWFIDFKKRTRLSSVFWFVISIVWVLILDYLETLLFS